MSARKQQTAVQWLVEQIQSGKIEIIYSNEIHSIKCIPNIIEQAKAMEKEQIIDAWNIGLCIQDTNDICGEYYYKETYETI